jgi:hypothetical protein
MLDPSRECVEGQDRCAAAIADKSTKPPVAAVIPARVAAGKGEETWPALKAAAADPAPPAGTFTVATPEAVEGDEEEESPPALEAVTADPVSTFTAARAEAGGDDDEEEEPPAALKVATADPAGTFTAVAGEACAAAPGVAAGMAMVGGRERVSATTLLTPAKCQMSEVYSAGGPAWWSMGPTLC